MYIVHVKKMQRTQRILHRDSKIFSRENMTAIAAAAPEINHPVAASFNQSIRRAIHRRMMGGK